MCVCTYDDVNEEEKNEHSHTSKRVIKCLCWIIKSEEEKIKGKSMKRAAKNAERGAYFEGREESRWRKESK